MKYFAILEDSLREALDAKVLYVMVGLSTLMILFVATLSFEPLPAERTMKALLDGTITVVLNARKPEFIAQVKKNPLFAMPNQLAQLQEVEVIRGEPDSPYSDYRVTLDVRFLNREAFERGLANKEKEIESVRKIFKDAEELNLLQVGDVTLVTREAGPESGHRLRFQVTVLSTPLTPRLWITRLGLFLGAVPLDDFPAPLGFQLYGVASIVVSIGAWVAILTGVIITGFFIPNMLQKGTIDLLLVKPIHRWALLLYKYLGGLTFIFLNTAYAVLGMYLVLGLRSGVYANTCLLLIPAITFFFAILYSVSALFAVLSRSTITAILMTCAAWFLFFAVGTVHRLMDNQRRIEVSQNLPPEHQRWTNNALADVVKVVHDILPRTSDLNHLNDLLLMSEFLTGSLSEANKLDTSGVDWRESLAVSAVFIALMLGIACWRFSVKDY